jgi:hypothetical protein
MVFYISIFMQEFKKIIFPEPILPFANTTSASVPPVMETTFSAQTGYRYSAEGCRIIPAAANARYVRACFGAVGRFPKKNQRKSADRAVFLA